MAKELDILRGCEIAPIDDAVDLDNNQKFKKLELTQGQKIQMRYSITHRDGVEKGEFSISHT